MKKNNKNKIGDLGDQISQSEEQNEKIKKSQPGDNNNTTPLVKESDLEYLRKFSLTIFEAIDIPKRKHFNFKIDLGDPGDEISQTNENHTLKFLPLGDNSKETRKKIRKILQKTLKETLSEFKQEVTRRMILFKKKVIPEMFEKVKRRYFRRKISPEVYEKQKQRETRRLFKTTILPEMLEKMRQKSETKRYFRRAICPEIYEKMKQRETRRNFRRTIWPDMLEKVKQRETKRNFKSRVRPELLKSVTKRNYRTAVLPEMIEKVKQRETKRYFKRNVAPELKKKIEIRHLYVKYLQCVLLNRKTTQKKIPNLGIRIIYIIKLLMMILTTIMCCFGKDATMSFIRDVFYYICAYIMSCNLLSLLRSSTPDLLQLPCP